MAKFKRVHSDRNKKIFIGLVVFVVLAVVIVVPGSRAKYQVAGSIDIVDGEVSWSPTDITVVAYFDGEELEEFPTSSSGYAVSEVVCDNGASATFDTSSYTIAVSDLTTRGTTCNVYFEENSCQGVSASEIIASKTQTERTDFSTTLTTDTTGIVYYVDDGMYGGTSYYFAGAATDNYVKFGTYANDVYFGYYSSTSIAYQTYNSLSECESASSYNYNCELGISAGSDMYWRIVRVNGDGSIRLIYQGASVDYTESKATIGLSAYNENYSNAEYAGFTYMSGYQRPSTKNGGTSSTIKNYLDTWYNNNLSNYASYLDTSGMFCNDRTSYTDNDGTTEYWVSSGTTLYYGAYIRLSISSENYSPSLNCENTIDIYTTPIGLITADEVAFAGAVYGGNTSTANTSFYLYSGIYWWTMSPDAIYYTWYPTIFLVGSIGALSSYDVVVNDLVSVRPVINLSSSVTLSGSGTSSEPYEVC